MGRIVVCNKSDHGSNYIYIKDPTPKETLSIKSQGLFDYGVDFDTIAYSDKVGDFYVNLVNDGFIVRCTIMHIKTGELLIWTSKYSSDIINPICDLGNGVVRIGNKKYYVQSINGRSFINKINSSQTSITNFLGSGGELVLGESPGVFFGLQDDYYKLKHHTSKYNIARKLFVDKVEMLGYEVDLNYTSIWDPIMLIIFIGICILLYCVL